MAYRDNSLPVAHRLYLVLPVAERIENLHSSTALRTCPSLQFTIDDIDCLLWDVSGEGDSGRKPTSKSPEICGSIVQIARLVAKALPDIDDNTIGIPLLQGYDRRKTLI